MIDITYNMLNRLANTKNQYQGDFKKVLCVCSAGLLRSPTIAWVLSNSPWNYNTRACGIAPEYALIPIDLVLVEWADEIVCADTDHLDAVNKFLPQCNNPKKPVYVLCLPDNYRTRDPKLIELIGAAYRNCTNNIVN